MGTALLFLVVYFIQYIFITIKPGEAGVLYRRLQGGTDLSQVYTEGLNIIFPWDIMYVYDTRIHERFISTNVLSSDGLTIKMDVTVRFFPDKKRLPDCVISRPTIS